MEKKISDKDIRRFYENQKAEVKKLEKEIEAATTQVLKDCIQPLLTSFKSSVATLEYIFDTE